MRRTLRGTARGTTRGTTRSTTTNAMPVPTQNPASSTRQGPALVALLLGAVCIAMSPIFVRVSETGPTATAFWRVALALPVLWPLYAFFGRRSESGAADPSARWLLATAGLAFTGDLFFWHFSVKFTSVANSTLLANLAAIFVTLAAWLLFRQKPSRLFLVGLITALTGVGVLVSTACRSPPRRCSAIPSA